MLSQGYLLSAENPIQFNRVIYSGLSSTLCYADSNFKVELASPLVSLNSRHNSRHGEDDWSRQYEEGEAPEKCRGTGGIECSDSGSAGTRGAGKDAGPANNGDVRHHVGQAVGGTL